MSGLRVATFNVNQFNDRTQQADDIRGLPWDDLDVVCVQECFRVDLRAVVPADWTVWQERPAGAGWIGRANGAVLYRTSLKARDCGYELAVDRKGDDLRARWIGWVRLESGIYVATAHRPPERDAALWPRFDRALGRWADGKRVVIGLDSNVREHGLLEKRTGLTWHGLGLDGVLTNLAATQPQRLPKGHSDHHPVAVTIT